MGALTKDRLGLVRALIETAPDAAVRDLDTALSAAIADDALAAVKDLIREEMCDRALRDSVIGPLAALCARRTDGFRQMEFPGGTLPRLWKIMRQRERQAVSAVKSALAADFEAMPASSETLCLSAAEALEAGGPEMAPVIDCLEQFQPGATREFIIYLRLTPLTRKAVRKLPGWLRNMSEDNTTSVRLLFKDADAIAQDSAPRMMELLQGQLGEPWQVLRIATAATHHTTAVYAALFTEFHDRVLDDVDARIATVRAFDADDVVDAAVAAAHALSVGIAEITEFESATAANKDSMQRAAKQKAALSNLAEGHIRKCTKLVNEALPVKPARSKSGVQLFEPDLQLAPEFRHMARVITMLTFFDRCRFSASNGGYGTVRGKVQEELADRLRTYIEDLLKAMHAGGPDLEPAQRYLDFAAEFLGLVEDEKSAQIVRRRALAVG